MALKIGLKVVIIPHGLLQDVAEVCLAWKESTLHSNKSRCSSQTWGIHNTPYHTHCHSNLHNMLDYLKTPQYYLALSENDQVSQKIIWLIIIFLHPRFMEHLKVYHHVFQSDRPQKHGVYIYIYI